MFITPALFLLCFPIFFIFFLNFYFYFFIYFFLIYLFIFFFQESEDIGDDSLTCEDEANEVYIIFASLTIFKFHIQFNPFLSFRMKMKRSTLSRNFRKNWNSTSWNCPSWDLTQGSTTLTLPKTHSSLTW